MNSNMPKFNPVKNRFLPTPQSVLKGLESEPKIKINSIKNKLKY